MPALPTLLHEQDIDWSALEDLEDDREPIPMATEQDFFAAAESAIDIAREVFDRADVDQSGALDALEMAGVVIDSLCALGANVPKDIETSLTGASRDEYIAKAMKRFDKDDNGVLELSLIHI
eukprot:TRINITY_DN6786_c0_g1_i2.p2 TRINITY_DN6786_c0_g1~~TRINITY_DN6786_c0_g1_i2.p2  ORF type:complete len:122 (-),score=36.42 TRINITY_DN6786_c0_g1_i2:82-447(-)